MNDDSTKATRSPAPRDPPPPSVAFFLLNLGRRTKNVVEERLRDHALTVQHLSVLGHLRRQPGLSYSELARRAGVTVQSMQATVADLERRGLVDPGKSGQGRRADLRLSVKGVRLLGLAEREIHSVDEELLADFTAGERADLEASLARLFRAHLTR